MIPKYIWQTYKTKNPPKVSLDCIKSWFDINPEYEWFYMDDSKCQLFISDHFSQEFTEMYKSLPYGVMKSDVWRIAIIYVYGGIYADLDTQCLKPIDSWINQGDLITSIEPPGKNIGNFCFASVPKHPALLNCLQLLVDCYYSENFMNKKSLTYIQDFGQHAFHTGILNYIESNENNNVKLFSFDDNAFSPFRNEKCLVWHQVASQQWTVDYNSWRRLSGEKIGTAY